MYDHYKKARNKSWEVLYDCKISEFPVDLGKIADFYGIKITLYSDTKLIQLFKEDALQGDGFVLRNEDETQVFINDKIHNRNRRRFTLAHELGHALLGHSLDEIHYRNSEIDSQTDTQEIEANVFARDILMPATVLAALDIHTPEEIMELCNVSRQSAEIRAERLHELYRRNKFNLHPAERKVREQFDDFIRNYQK